MRTFLAFVIISLFACCFSHVIHGQQNDFPNLFPRFELHSYTGGVLAHRSTMDSLAQNPFWGNELRIGLQTDGSKYWHELYNYPIFGLGLFTSNFYNDIIGKPKAAFLFMELPFLRKEKTYFSTSWSVGATFNINEYDSLINPQNIAIGTDVNVYIDFSFLYKYKITNRLELGAGIKLQHFSNGAYAYPNLGLNMFSGTASIAYSLGNAIEKYKISEQKQSFKKYEVVPLFACGWRAKGQSHNHIRYFNSTTSISVNKRMNAKRTLGVGIDQFYQGYLIDSYEDKENVRKQDLMSYAAFLASDMVVNRFRLAVHLGFYMYKPVEFGLPIYERVALRFYATEWLFGNMSIKAHGAKAEFLEWGIGCTF